MRIVRRRGGVLVAVVAETQLARWEIRHGRFQRSMAVIAGFAAVVSGCEAYVQHLRGAFDHWLMWTPVGLAPAVVVSAAAAVVSERAARLLLPLVSLVALVDGLVGFVYHLRGIRRLPGGFKLGQYNVVMGPPVFAPLLVGMVGVLGTIAAFLRRERRPNRLLEAVAAPQVAAAAVGASLRPLRRTEVEMAEGRFQQGLAVLAAVFAVLSGGEAYFEHLRGSFNRRLMWTPVWITPPMVAAGLGAARSRRVAVRVLPLVSVVTFLDGMLGFLLHLQGIERMPGGSTTLRFDLMLGPPLFAPLLFCAVGLLGMIASVLRREESR